MNEMHHSQYHNTEKLCKGKYLLCSLLSNPRGKTSPVLQNSCFTSLNLGVISMGERCFLGHYTDKPFPGRKTQANEPEHVMGLASSAS